jgi:hypothetical protein
MTDDDADLSRHADLARARREEYVVHAAGAGS